MNRADFTYLVARLILWVVGRGWSAILGEAERSTEEQIRMYVKGLSKCDGVRKKSGHQYRDAGGRYAVDLFIHTGDGKIDNPKLYEEAHQVWSEWGGSDMITRDLNHFEIDTKHTLYGGIKEV